MAEQDNSITLTMRCESVTIQANGDRTGNLRSLNSEAAITCIGGNVFAPV